METTPVADRQLFVFCDPVITRASSHLPTLLDSPCAKEVYR